jgi:predicted nuclease of predicted toxin-antitoxin system
VVESRERSPDPGDRKLLEWAAAERRVLVTMDKDFGELIFAGRASHCGLVRFPDLSAERRIALMERILADYSHELAAHSVITVRGGRVRISRSSE